MRLRVIDGLGYPEVAERLRCTEQNARQRVSRGLRALGLALQERGIHPTTEVEA
jgi:DNA-directed RNA polymerase specialized sigma24 family protein